MMKQVWHLGVRLVGAGMLAVSLAGPAQAGGGHDVVLDRAKVDVLDTASLQRGASLYAQYCMGCHSMKYMRVSRVAKDLDWTPEEAVATLQVLRNGQGKPHDMMMTTIDPAKATEAFGTLPPDLSLATRLRGEDWVYTFLRSYQRAADGSISNSLFAGVSMPYIVEGLQRDLPPAEFDAAMRDLVSFMAYASEPSKPQRLMLGWWVLAFLAVLFVLTYLLKKEYWRDVKSSA